MIDFGDAPEQKELGSGGVTIPPKSMVKVIVKVQEPINPDPQDPCVNIKKTGLKGVDIELTVMSGTYEGVRFFDTWFLPPSMQTVSLNSGQEGICNNSKAKMRAALEASRGLDHRDPNANRTIQQWYDFDGMELPVKVGVNKPQAEDKYVKNNISLILIPGDQDFDLIMSGGEIISDLPIPEIHADPAAPRHSQPSTKVVVPSWANRKKQ